MIDEHRLRLLTSARLATYLPYQPQPLTKPKTLAFAESQNLVLLGLVYVLSLSGLDLNSIRLENIEDIGGFLTAMGISALKILVHLRVKVGHTR